MSKKNILLISTGGTIEKTYDELSGLLSNQISVLDYMLASLQLNGVRVSRLALMSKDSLEMTPEDHKLIAETVEKERFQYSGIIIVHGTDRLAESGEVLVERFKDLTIPVVLTGAMRPWELRRTDALQNLTEALLAVQLLEAGIYVAMHNRVLRFPGVCKDLEAGTFVERD